MAQGPVEKATRAELRKLGASSMTEALPAAAVSLAKQMDAAKGGMASAAVAAQLRLIIADVARSAVRPEEDEIDAVNAEPPKLRVVPDR